MLKSIKDSSGDLSKRPIDLGNYPTCGITEAKILDELRKPITDLYALMNRTMVFSDDDLATVKSAHQLVQNLVDERFAYAIENIEARRRNLSVYQDVEVISLGFDCLSRAVTTRWGLKKPRQLGELTHPFDTSIHPPAAVRHLLETDFADYMENVTFSSSDGENFPVRRDLGIKFNHESGDQWANDNFFALKETYERRVRNFKLAVGATSPTVFLLHTHGADTKTIEDVKAIFENLRSRRGDKPTRFVWLFTPSSESLKWTSAPDLGTDCAYIIEPYPFEHYVWYRNKHAFSPRGIRFEKRVVRALSSILSDAGWVDKNTVPVAYTKFAPKPPSPHSTTRAIKFSILKAIKDSDVWARCVGIRKILSRGRTPT